MVYERNTQVDDTFLIGSFHFPLTHLVNDFWECSCSGPMVTWVVDITHVRILLAVGTPAAVPLLGHTEAVRQKNPWRSMLWRLFCVQINFSVLLSHQLVEVTVSMRCQRGKRMWVKGLVLAKTWADFQRREEISSVWSEQSCGKRWRLTEFLLLKHSW